ncbi:peptidase M23, partial [Leptospira interrogans]
EFKADWRKESPAQTDASLAALKSAGYDTSGLEKFVQDYRNGKAANSSQGTTTSAPQVHSTQGSGLFTNAYNAVVGGAKDLWNKVTGGGTSHVVSTGPEHYDTVMGDKLIYKLHEKGDGFLSNSRQPTADEHRYGQKALVDTISNTINEWRQTNPNHPIVTNDLGYKSGGIDPHAIAGEKYYAKHHQNGNAVDLSYMVTPGVRENHVNYDQNKAYNRDKTIEYIKTISRNIPEGVGSKATNFIKFNDPAVHEYFKDNPLPNLHLKQDKNYGEPGAKVVHSNHLHLQLDLPKVQ